MTGAVQPSVGCEHEHEDAAYVLGALSGEDRSAYERHLPGCAACSRAVAELAGLPGLLTRVPVEQVESAPRTPDVPDTLLPDLVRRVGVERRRRRLVTVGLVAAAAAAVVALGATVAHTRGGPGRDDAVATAPAVAMRTLGDDPVAATISLTSVGWGTRLELTCDERRAAAESAGAAGRGDPSTTTADDEDWSSYAMFVHSRDGRVEQVATWQAVPGGIIHVSGATATDRSDITDVDVRNAGGVRVLDLAP